MVKFWELLLMWGLCSYQSLSSSVGFIGSPQECEKAHFVPGYHLAGEGFDIVTMKGKAAYVIDTETWKLKNGTCRMFENSYMGNEKQKVPISVVDWRIIPKCKVKISSSLYDSVESLVSDSTSSVTNDWKIGLKIPLKPSVTTKVGLGGSHSRAAEFGIAKSKQDRYTFVQHSVSCGVYGYRLVRNPPLSQEFQSAVDSLPSFSRANASLYSEIVQTYGTHYISHVTLGGEIKALTSFKTCMATLDGLTATDVSDCLTAEASAKFVGKDNFNVMDRHCNAKKDELLTGKSFSSVFSERDTDVNGGDINGDVLFQGRPDESNKWLDSLKSSPGLLKYNLKPLHTLLASDHHARIGLKKEVEKYITNNAVLKKCSESCLVGHRSSHRDPCACVCTDNQNLRSNCCPAGKGLAALKVFNLYAKNLYGDKWSKTDGSVQVIYKNQVKHTIIIQDNNNPKWPEIFEFGPIVINMADRLIFAVFDADTYWNSDLLGACSFKLHSGEVTEMCTFNYGALYFSYSVECAPSLGGYKCDEYVPSPINRSLAEEFHTRNGVLLGESGMKFVRSESDSDTDHLSTNVMKK